MFHKSGPDRRNGQGALVAVHNPRSAAAEAYRTLRTNLQFSAIDRPLRTLLVTSPGPADGRTTVVANLGASLAESGKRVLLVDCDLRRPALHELFGLPLAPGLTNTLVEGGPNPPIRQTAVPGLSVLTAGDPPPNPAEFVASGRLASLLERLGEQYDVLVLDSAPAGLVSDAAVLAPRTDGILLVVSAGRTKRELARRAKEQLENAGARILGTVLNNAKLERRAREYYADDRR